MFNYGEMVFNVRKENKCLVIRFLTDYKKFMMFEEAFQKNTNFSSSNFLEDSRETKVFFHTKGNSLETLNSFNELTMQKVPSKTKSKDSLIVSFYKLKLEFDKCSEVQTDLTDSLTNDSSHQMMREYQDLKLKHEKVLRSFVNFCQNTKLSSFILHFLFDLQSEEGQLTSLECHHFCEFLVNRYFKILRVKVFREIEKLSEFQKFFNLKNVEYSKKYNSNDKRAKLSLLEKTGYSFGCSLLDFKHRGFDKNKFYDQNFIETFLAGSTPQNDLFYFQNLLYLYRLVCWMILKFVSDRFATLNTISDVIEDLMKPIIHIIKSLLNLFNVLKNKIIKKEHLPEVKDLFGKLNSVFVFPEQSIFENTRNYLRFREAREYLQRKKKSKFIRPKRNDEKLKKVYKNLIKIMSRDFVSQIDVCSVLPIVQNYPNEFPKIKNLNKLVQITFHQKKQKKSVSLQESAFSMSKTEQNKLFYIYYFGSVSKKRGILMNHFYDPLKASLKNEKHRSFNLDYFDLLLSSGIFKREVLDLLENGGLLFKVFEEYPLSVKTLFETVPTILSEQVRDKSKFPWTLYEYFYAIYFFKKKLGLDKKL